MDATEKSELDALRERVRDLETALGRRNNSIQATFKLTPLMADVVGLLLVLPAVEPDLISRHIKIRVQDVKVTIHRLRRSLSPWDLDIKSKWGVGYWFDAADKRRAQAWIDCRHGAG